MKARHYIIGVDIGQIHQPTAIAILEQENKYSETGNKSELVQMRLRQLERMPADAGYPELAATLSKFVADLDGKEECKRPDLIVNITGAGLAVTEPIRKGGLKPESVLITNGSVETRGDDGVWRLSRAQLAGTMTVHMQDETLRLSEKLPLTPTLVAEFENFKKRPPTDKPDDGEVWREGPGDDLVFAVGIAAWWGANNRPKPNAKRRIQYPPSHPSRRRL